jgi:hypothetical protein
MTENFISNCWSTICDFLGYQQILDTTLVNSDQHIDHNNPDDPTKKFEELMKETQVLTNTHGDQFEYRILCYESYPCQHRVKLPGLQQWTLYSAGSIRKYLVNEGYPLPDHFAQYGPQWHTDDIYKDTEK